MRTESEATVGQYHSSVARAAALPFLQFAHHR
jgi:hypothetical protein